MTEGTDAGPAVSEGSTPSIPSPVHVDRPRVIEAITKAKTRPGMYGMRTHKEAVCFLYGIHETTGLLPSREMTEWLLADGDPVWGGRGGISWQQRIAMVVVSDYFVLDENGRQRCFTNDEEAAMRNAIFDFALAWLRRRELD